MKMDAEEAVGVAMALCVWIDGRGTKSVRGEGVMC